MAQSPEDKRIAELEADLAELRDRLAEVERERDEAQIDFADTVIELTDVQFARRAAEARLTRLEGALREVLDAEYILAADDSDPGASHRLARALDAAQALLADAPPVETP